MTIESIRGSQFETDRRLAMSEAGLTATIALLIALVIVICALGTGIAYHWLAYGSVGDVTLFAGVGVLVAGLYLGTAFYRNDLSPSAWRNRKHSRLGALAFRWIASFAILMAIGFLTKTSTFLSRGWLSLFFGVGLAALTACELVLVRMVRSAIANRRVTARRVLLIGSNEEVARFRKDIKQTDGLAVCAVVLVDAGGDTTAPDVFTEAIQAIRLNNISDVVLLGGWRDKNLVDRCVEALAVTPASIHLDAGELVTRFGHLKVSRLGRLPALEITVAPLTTGEAIAKRVFDLAVAVPALVLLCPLLLGIAVAIKFDSAGPVFFRQRRRGYNHIAFPIIKFRTMTTLDDGDVIIQAQKNDTRITRVGRILRRYNLDELPQLINVIRGEMSIVGPRPHAVAHDKWFEQRINRYQRRLNMRPGITGWAQINGLRGETDTDEKMQRRVEHDLYYLDNWSIGFDIYIVLMTVISAQSYKNAH